jgi:hypothetical protein
VSVANPRLAGPQRFGRIVIVGGGCYGGYYVRQLRRAVDAGAVECRRVVVVDHDPQCAVAADVRPDDPLVEVVVAEWRAYFARTLGGAAPDDAIVPSPLMPHLLRDWLADAARARWPDRDVRTEPLPRPPEVPWERAAPDGTHYVSFATWMCPINCIEPEICPHTRDTRHWSLAPTLRAYASELGGDGAAPAAYLFQCLHRAYGVGMIDVADVLAANAGIAGAGRDGRAVKALVGTVSHCHGAVSLLAVGEPPTAAG